AARLWPATCRARGGARPLAVHGGNSASRRFRRDRSVGNRPCRGGPCRAAARPRRAVPRRRRGFSAAAAAGRAAGGGVWRRLGAGWLEGLGRAGTRGGCRFVPWRGQLLVLRELSAAAAPVRLVPGTELLWDRRFAVSIPRTAKPDLVLGHLGQSGMRAAIDGDDHDLPRLVHPVLPAVWDDSGLVGGPYLAHHRAGAPGPPRIAFCPINALTHAGFTVV